MPSELSSRFPEGSWTKMLSVSGADVTTAFFRFLFCRLFNLLALVNSRVTSGWLLYTVSAEANAQIETVKTVNKKICLFIIVSVIAYERCPII